MVTDTYCMGIEIDMCIYALNKCTIDLPICTHIWAGKEAGHSKDGFTEGLNNIVHVLCDIGQCTVQCLHAGVS